MNKVNNNYLKFVSKVFAFFEGHKVGQGLYLFRMLMAKRQEYSLVEYNLIHFTIYNLIDQSYLSYKEGDFIVLTQDGYDYMQGEYMPCNKVCFNHLVNPQKTANERFEDLWLLIGKEETALFYVKGPIFYNVIKPYLKNLYGDYSDYMEELKGKELSTSRIKWYRNLYCQLSSEESELFLNDLSKEVELYYADAEDDDYSDELSIALGFEGAKLNEQSTDSVKENVLKQPKKKIFISYCWEDEEHKNGCIN